MQNLTIPNMTASFVGSDVAISTEVPARIPARVCYRFIPHPPSAPDGQSDQEYELLERLDDVIFSAITGNAEALLQQNVQNAAEEAEFVEEVPTAVVDDATAPPMTE